MSTYNHKSNKLISSRRKCYRNATHLYPNQNVLTAGRRAWGKLL